MPAPNLTAIAPDPALISAHEDKAKLQAIDRTQAVIEFNLDGGIITANQNFLGAMGYTLADIQGKNHAIFVEPVHAASAAYREFWAKLNRGDFQAGQYK